MADTEVSVPTVEVSEVASEEITDEEPTKQLDPPCMDLTDYKPKVDHFENIHALPSDAGILEGAPNFRQIKDFPVFGCAQPTETGFKKVLEKVEQSVENKDSKMIWFNMRQEPVVYINNQPFAPRHPDHVHDNLEVLASVQEMDTLELHYENILKNIVESDPDKMLKTSRDKSNVDNPMDRENIEDSTRVDSIKSLQGVYEDIRTNLRSNFNHVRVPVVEDCNPDEKCFDILVDALKEEPAATQCVFSCQAGRGRTTLGMVVTCLIKELQISCDLKRMGEIGLLPLDTVQNIISSKFETKEEITEDDDPFVRGEFEVIKELMEKLPGAVEAKKKVDRIIDLCGPAPKGTGLQNLRECIIETKWKYDVAPEDRQVAFKQMILSFMERYFYLICFSAYASTHGPSGFDKSFTQWMSEHADLKTMIDEGKDKLEWYRQVDPAKLNTLKELMMQDNYKDNLSTLIKTIYEFAFLTYSDLPRGQIKNNSMRKLAAKTLMEILPENISKVVHQKLEQQGVSPEFLTLVGMVSYYAEDAK